VVRQDCGGAAASPAAHLRRDNAGAVAVLIALVLPVLLIPVGATVEVSRWSTVRQRLQLTADLAALAGGNAFAATSNAQSAAIAAAQVAELNGGRPGTSRVWDSSQQTLTDGNIAVVVGAGLWNSSNVDVSVTVSQPLTLMMAGFLSGNGATISATAWSEISTAQDCLLSLGSSGGITLQGTAGLTLAGCALQSNAGISSGGSAKISAPSLWARTTISGRGITGAQHPNSGTVSDPIAAATPAVATAFAHLAAGAGTAVSVQPGVTQALTPGTFSSWDIKGIVTLAAGLYTVNGTISLGAQASLSGSGVTIVTSGAMSAGGGAAISLSAARNDGTAVNGAIPGIVFAGNSTAASSFGGNSSASVTGVVYYPNGPLAFSGVPQAGANGCLEVVAASIDMQGTSSMASKCGSYYANAFGARAAVGLVQ
jgi:Flp pilus assembly protein TadG